MPTGAHSGARSRAAFTPSHLPLRARRLEPVTLPTGGRSCAMPTGKMTVSQTLHVTPASTRLTYRRSLPEDAACLAELETVDGVMRFIGSLPVPTGEAANTLFVIEQEGLPIGLGGFVRSQAFDGKDWELICVIAVAHQGRGVASEACTALLSWGVQTRGWLRVLACVHEQNSGGLALALRLGFSECGRRVSDPDVLVLERAG